MVWPGMLALGAVVGFLGGLLGIGGGFWPFRCWRCCLAWIRPRLAGTALVMIAPNVVLAFWRYSQHHPIALRRTLTLGAVSIVVSYPAARLAVSLDHHTLRWIFIGFCCGWWAIWAGSCTPVAPNAGALAPRIPSERWLLWCRWWRVRFRVCLLSVAAQFPHRCWWACLATARRQRRAWGCA